MEKSVLTFTVIVSDSDKKVLTDVLEVVKSYYLIATRVLKPQSELLFQQFAGLLPNIRFMLKPDQDGNVIINLYQLRNLFKAIDSMCGQMMIGRSDKAYELFEALSECSNSLQEVFDCLINPAIADMK